MRQLSVVAGLLAAASLFCACGSADAPAPQPVAAPVPPPPPALDPAQSLEIHSAVLGHNEFPAAALEKLGVDAKLTHELVGALDGVFDFRKARPGDEFRVTTRGGELQDFELRRGPVEEYVVEREGDKLVGRAREFQVEKQVATVQGNLEVSLYGAIEAAGEEPSLAVSLAEVLAWDIDFYNDPRKGDSFKIIIEKYFHDGKFIRYGDILGAEYKGELVGTKRVFRYANPKSGELEYYAEDGSAAKRAFLKSPLKFANVTSRFGSRFHPVLKYVKMHEGVDYAASMGTPVWAVGDGTVTHAGWAGACGKMVSIRHNNGLESIYCHFSRIAPGVHAGGHVSQKQLIGYSGATGRVTGPHLHFAVKRGGRFINPLSLKFPPSEPLPAAQLPAFHVAIGPMLEKLGAPQYATAEQKPAPSAQ